MHETDRRPGPGHERQHRNTSETYYLANSTVRVEESDAAGLIAQIERHATGQAPNPQYGRLDEKTAQALREVANVE